MPTIRLGGRDTTFTKSDGLVGVRSQPGMTEAFSRSINKVVPSIRAGEQLGGFRVLDIGLDPVTTNDKLDILRAEPAISMGTHVYHSSDDLVPFVPTGQIFIAFKAGTPAAAQENVFIDHHLQILDTRGDDAFIAQVTPLSPNPMKIAEALLEDPVVEACEPELATPADLKNLQIPPTPLLAEQWHLQNRGTHRGTSVGFTAGADARVVPAWTLAGTLGTAAVVVAVIDDGFDLGHPDLKAAGKYVHPWDFTRGSADPSPDPTLRDWHGTACAGVAVALTEADGVLGAAPGATLLPIRWGPELSDSQIESWFAYAKTKGAWIVSCSWGAKARNYPLSTRSARAIADCARQGRGGLGCVILFAAGNENRQINDPASSSVAGFAIHPDVITVAASNSRDQRSTYSNFGSEVDLCAPSSGEGGWGVLTCDVTGTRLVAGIRLDLGYDPGDYTYGFGGTSSATPLAAGVCALILSIRPRLSANEVKDLLVSTARKIAGLGQGATRSDEVGFGCVDAERALATALALPA